MTKNTQTIMIDELNLENYQKFLAAKSLPIHRVVRNRIFVEDFSKTIVDPKKIQLSQYLFDYEQVIVKLALKKKRYAVFADVGLGKTAIFLEWLRQLAPVVAPQKLIILTQLHLIQQTIEEDIKWYGDTQIININREFDGDVFRYLESDYMVGIVNIDKFRNTIRLSDHIGALVLDESSCLKNETGVIRTNIINGCKGIPFKMACTATPAPNDRQEYANHALFLDYIDNFKQFFQKFFYNTGDSGAKYVLKPHAQQAFYEFLSTWSIFLKNPANYGFGDNLKSLLPPHFEWVHIPLTQEQMTAMARLSTGGQLNMFEIDAGGISKRTKLSQIAKGFIYEH